MHIKRRPVILFDVPNADLRCETAAAVAARDGPRDSGMRRASLILVGVEGRGQLLMMELGGLWSGQAVVNRSVMYMTHVVSSCLCMHAAGVAGRQAGLPTPAMRRRRYRGDGRIHGSVMPANRCR